MSNSLGMGTRVANYFFVAGLHDDNIIPLFEYSKKYKKNCEDDEFYYLHQQQAIARVEEKALLSESSTNFSRLNPNLCQTNSQSSTLYSTKSKTEDKNLHNATLCSSDNKKHIDYLGKEKYKTEDGTIATQDSDEVNTEDSKNCAFDAFGIIRSETSSLDKVIKRMSYVEISSKKWYNNSSISNRIKRHSISFPKNRSLETSFFSDKKIASNIFDLRYTPTILMKYPKEKSIANVSFPAYTAMFCFPNDIKLYCGEEPPPAEKYHSFTTTDEDGITVYGGCIVFYERVVERLKEPINKAINEYLKTNVDDNTMEYAQHLKEKINKEKIQLDKAKENQIKSTMAPDREDTLRNSSEYEEIIKTCQENIGLFNELLEPIKICVCTANDIWVPKAIGLLGRMPWIDLYGDWLKIFVDSVIGVGGNKSTDSNINIESTIINIVDEVPLPPPGRFEIGLVINKRPIFFSRPPINTVPLLKNFSLYPVFRALSPHLILTIVETLLAEGKVLFLSQHKGMLSMAAETFRYLLFPFYWQFVFIPILPERLLTYLQSPVPYMIGFQGTLGDLDEFVPNDTCVVNLDSNSIHQSERVVQLPQRQRRKLILALEEYAPLHTKSKVPYGVPLSVQYAFPKGKMVLNCNRSKTINTSMNPPKSKEFEYLDVTSPVSNFNSSFASKTSQPYLNDSNSRSSTESLSSRNGKEIKNSPQYPGNAKLSDSAGSRSSSTSDLQMTASRVMPNFYGFSSTPPLNRPSPKLNRISVPMTTITSSNMSTQENQDSNDEVFHRMSEPINVKPQIQQNPKSGHFNHFSESYKTSRSMFYNGEHNYSSSNTIAASPQTSSVSSSYRKNLASTDNVMYSQIPRRVRYIEGHMMSEVFSSELGQFQEHRCVCGKLVSEEKSESSKNRVAKNFMHCQECHLITHGICADKILHPCLPNCFEEDKVQDAFVKTFASLLYSYRQGFIDNTDEKIGPSIVADGSINKSNTSYKFKTIFLKEKFIRSSDKDTREYLSKLMDSQMFTQFIIDRIIKPPLEPEILVFDEYIKLKLNRSKFKLVKEDTPFLNDSSFKVSQIIWSVPPKTVSNDVHNSYKRFPIDIQI